MNRVIPEAITNYSLGTHMLKKLTWMFSALLAIPPLYAAAPDGQDYAARVAQVLKQTPLIDGHNDLPWEIRERFHSKSRRSISVPTPLHCPSRPRVSR